MPSDLQNDRTSTTEPSDLPSLRRQHVTAGYRDGVSTSKGEHVQRGFDAGFPVGAQLGMRAGTILGIMEGITRGLEDRSVSGVVKKPVVRGVSGPSAQRSDEARSAEAAESRRLLREKTLKIYLEASKALEVQAVFAGSNVEAGSGSSAQNATDRHAGEPAEAQLGRKGEAVISKWEDKVAVPQWEKNMEALEMKESQGDNEGDKAAMAEQS